MIIDDMRNGKPVEIEVKNQKIVSARVNLNAAPLLAEPSCNDALKTAQSTNGESRESNGQIANTNPAISRGGIQSLNGQKSHTYINLGLALLSTKEWGNPFGVGRTLQEIADYCGCTREAIRRIEHRALRKMRAALYRDKSLEKELKDLFGNVR